jgi:hypothetical protein
MGVHMLWGFYSIVMKCRLCISLLHFVAWLSPYHLCFGGHFVYLGHSYFYGGAVLLCCQCLEFVWRGRAWVAMCVLNCTGLCGRCFMLLFVSM